MEIVWDPHKASANFKKHAIDFAEAVSVLYDVNAVTIEDTDHEEERFVTIGMDEQGRILVVVYAYRGETLRLISARKATKSEQEQVTR